MKKIKLPKNWYNKDYYGQQPKTLESIAKKLIEDSLNSMLEPTIAEKICSPLKPK